MTHEKPTERSVPAQKRSRERRERILEAAAQVFAEKGLGFATMEAIAHEAGTSIGSLYRFFRDKEAIFQTLHEEHFQKARAFLTDVVTAEDLSAPWDTLVRRVLAAIFSFTLADPAFRAVWASMSFTGAMVVEGQAENRAIAQSIAPLLGQVFPKLPEARRLPVTTLLVEIVSAMTLVAAQREGAEREAIVTECQDLVVRYLAPYAPDSAAPRKPAKARARASRSR